jgi:hypothetical protein
MSASTTRKLVSCKGKLYELAHNALFNYWQELPDIVVSNHDALGFSWNGGLIPFPIWEQIVAFMRWTQKEFDGEGHCTLFYNLTTKEWKAWPFPQRPMGMTVSLLADDPQYALDRKQFGGDWVMAGSVHHHCSASAFQSGTDSADEKDKEGIHITVGHVLADKVDLHARKVMDGVMSECTLDEFIDEPDYVRLLPKWMRKGLAAKDAWKETYGNIDATAFPEEWKANVRKPVSFTEPTVRGVHYPWVDQQRRTLISGPTTSGNSGVARMPSTNTLRGRHIEEEIHEYIDHVMLHFSTDEKEIKEILSCDAKLLPKGKQQTLVYQIQAVFKKLTIGGVAIALSYVLDQLSKRIEDLEPVLQPPTNTDATSLRVHDAGNKVDATPEPTGPQP